MSTATEEYDDIATSDAYDHWFWRLVRGTLWGTVDLVKASYVEARFHGGRIITKTRMAFKRYRAERRFGADDTPDPDEIPAKKWAPVRYTCGTCGRTWKSANGFNAHFATVHLAEVPDASGEKPGTPVFGRRPHGKRKTRGRRPPTATVDKRSAWKRIGERGMSDGIAQKLKNAWAEISGAKPRRLSQIREDLLGLEQVHGRVSGEAIDAYRHHLIRIGFDPAILQNLVRAKAALELAAGHFSGTIAVIEEAMAGDIAAAKARAAGTKPADSVLAN